MKKTLVGLWCILIIVSSGAYAGVSDLMGRWVNTHNSNDRLTIAKSKDVYIIEVYNYKTLTAKIPASYKDGILTGHGGWTNISMFYDVKSKCLISNGVGGSTQYLRLTLALEKKLEAERQSEAASRERRRRQEEAQTRESERKRAREDELFHARCDVQTAIESDSVSSLRRLLDKYPEMLRKSLGLADAPRGTLLHEAACRFAFGCAEFLINQGLDVNAKTPKGKYTTGLAAESYNETPLLLAVRAYASDNSLYPAKLKIIRLLLEHGADPNVQDGDGNTALHYVVMAYFSNVPEADRPEVVASLLNKGANPNLQNKEDKTPLNMLEQELGVSNKSMRITKIHMQGEDTAGQGWAQTCYGLMRAPATNASTAGVSRPEDVSTFGNPGAVGTAAPGSSVPGAVSNYQAVAALVKAFEMPLTSRTYCPFSDVPSDSPYFGAVNTVAAQGIVIGYPDGTFGGNRIMTRYEWARVLWHYIRTLDADALRKLDKMSLTPAYLDVPKEYDNYPVVKRLRDLLPVSKNRLFDGDGPLTGSYLHASLKRSVEILGLWSEPINPASSYIPPPPPAPPK